MFEYISVFDFTNKIDRKNWKPKSRPEYWIEKYSFVYQFLPAREIMEQLNYFHAGKCATEIIPSYLVILPRLKISMAANRAIFKHG